MLGTPLAVTMETDWGLDVARVLAVPLLVAINGLFVAAEFAFVAVRRTRVEELVGQGVKGAKAVETALRRLDRSIAATQLGITLTSIVLGGVSEPALAALFEPLFRAVPGGWGTFATHSAATVIAFLLITFVHVSLGELVPKNIALQAPDRVALWLAAPLNVFARLVRPLTLLVSGTSNLVLRATGFQPGQTEEMVHSVEELLLLIEDTEEAGGLEPDRADLVENAFRLTDKRVGDCMIPRERMASLELMTPPDRVLEAVRSGAHTRMPVYEGTPDRVVGIVNTKDLFYLFSLKGVVVLEDALYAPLYLKPDESLDNALRLFRKARRHMALVRDEAGRIVGLITLEDVIEEIVGDIEDEHDRPARKVKLVPRLKKLRPAPPQPTKPAGGSPAR